MHLRFASWAETTRPCPSWQDACSCDEEASAAPVGFAFVESSRAPRFLQHRPPPTVSTDESRPSLSTGKSDEQFRRVTEGNTQPAPAVSPQKELRIIVDGYKRCHAQRLPGLRAADPLLLLPPVPPLTSCPPHSVPPLSIQASSQTLDQTSPRGPTPASTGSCLPMALPPRKTERHDRAVTVQGHPLQRLLVRDRCEIMGNGNIQPPSGLPQGSSGTERAFTGRSLARRNVDVVFSESRNASSLLRSLSWMTIFGKRYSCAASGRVRVRPPANTVHGGRPCSGRSA